MPVSRALYDCLYSTLLFSAHALLENSNVWVNHAKRLNVQKMSSCALMPRNVSIMNKFVIPSWIALMAPMK